MTRNVDVLVFDACTIRNASTVDLVISHIGACLRTCCKIGLDSYDLYEAFGKQYTRDSLSRSVLRIIGTILTTRYDPHKKLFVPNERDMARALEIVKRETDLHDVDERYLAIALLARNHGYRVALLTMDSDFIDEKVIDLANKYGIEIVYGEKAIESLRIAG